MKYLLVVLVVGIVLWLMFGMRRRVGRPPPRPPARAVDRLPAMVACAHCGVHLPDKDAPHDAEGRPYCSDAHRVAGPR
jgi:uncharacterized protein